MKKLKKIISLLLTVIMVSSTVHFAAFAKDTVTLCGTYTTVGKGENVSTPASVKAVNSDTGKSYSAEITEKDGKGYYCFELPSGTYDISICKRGYLEKSYSRLKLGNKDMLIPDTAILPGDLNSDGRVDTKDLAVIMRGMNSDEAYAVLRDNADIDEDGILNVTDIGYLKANYNKTSEEYGWINVMNLRTDYRNNPMGIDYENPVFSWILDSAKKDVMQTAYNIGVASSFEKAVLGEFDIWESGKITSGDTAIKYAGTALSPQTKYFWTVSAYDNEGNEIPTSEIAEFETGLMGGFGEENKWITAPLALSDSTDFTLEIKGNLHRNVRNNYSGMDISFSPLCDEIGSRLRVILQISSNYSQLRVVSGTEWNSYSTIAVQQNFITNPGAYYNTTDEITLKIVAADGKADFYVTGAGFETETKIMSATLAFSGKSFKKFGTVMLEDTNFSDITSCIVTDNGTGETIFNGIPRLIDHASLFRHTFTLDGGKSASDITSARLYSTAAGSQIMYLNGERASDDYLAPGKMQHTSVMYYQTYDVTGKLTDGENTIAAEVGHGWYNAGAVGARYGNSTALRAKLVITYNDGTVQTINTDESWLSTREGHTYGDRFYNGHWVDGRKFIENWNANGCDTSSEKWLPVVASDTYTTDYGYTISENFVGENMEPVRCIEVLNPVSVNKIDSDSYVYKFPRNIAGTARITAKAPENTKMRIYYGEWTESGGTVTDTQHLGQNGSDIYIFRGDSTEETVEFDFAFHGFEFIQIDGLTEPLDFSKIEGLVLTSDIEKTGTLETSSTLINKYIENTYNSVQGNFVSAIIDCPTREKNTWTGDSGVFSSAAGFNADVYHIYRNFQELGRASQGNDGGIGEILPPQVKPESTVNTKTPALWGGDTLVMVGYEMFYQYGDISFITDNYNAMTKWVDFVFENKISTESEVPASDKERFNYIIDATDLRLETNYGDHLNYYNGKPGTGYRCLEDKTTTYSWYYTSHPEIATAYTAYSCMLISEMAQILADRETDTAKKQQYLFDAEKFSDYHSRLAKAWRTNFVKEDGFTCRSGGTSLTSAPYTYTDGEGSQTSYAMGIMFDLYESDEAKQKAADKLASLIEKDGYITTTGFPGIHILYEALTEYGHFDTAMKMMECTKQPSLTYPITQGASTIWETYYGTTNSRNHYSFGTATEWLYKYVLGIDHGYNSEDPAFRHFLLHPNYASYGDSLTYASGELMTYSGKIKAAWKLSDDGKIFTYDIEIPANTTATLMLPVESEEAFITESGIPAEDAVGITYIKTENGKAYFEAASGAYSFKVDNTSDTPEVSEPEYGENSYTYEEISGEEYGFSGRWYDRIYNNRTCYGSYTAGSEFYFAVEDTENIFLKVTGDCSDANPAYLAISVDGGEFARMPAPNGTLKIASGLDKDQKHTVRVILDSHYLYQANKWHLGNGFAFERAVVDEGGKITGIRPLEKTILYYGDSITEGVGCLANDTSGASASHSALGAYPYSISKALGAVSFTNGYGATGILTAGCAGVPRCIEIFDTCYLGGQSVDYPEEPGAIVLNHGHNDGPQNASEDFISEYKILLAKFTETFPNAPVFCVVPFNQNRSADILTAYNEYVSESGRDDIYFIATEDYYTDKSAETTDGAHPTMETAQKFGKMLAKEIEDILGKGYFDAE